jgi:hypothetical protein
VRPHKFNTIFLPLPHILPPETLTIIFSPPVSVGEQAIHIKASDKKCGVVVRVRDYEFVTTDPEVPGSIPGATSFS